MKTAFVDTGTWIALQERRDQRCPPVAEHFARLRAERARLATSNYVVDEPATHLRYDVGPQAALRFGATLEAKRVSHTLELLWVDELIEAQAWRLLEHFGDVALSLTDATRAALARARHIREVCALDRDFEAFGLIVSPGVRR